MIGAFIFIGIVLGVLVGFLMCGIQRKKHFVEAVKKLPELKEKIKREEDRIKIIKEKKNKVKEVLKNKKKNKKLRKRGNNAFKKWGC